VRMNNGRDRPSPPLERAVSVADARPLCSVVESHAGSSRALSCHATT
jgi:hypothetical protein